MSEQSQLDIPKGTVAVMAMDLATTPASGLRVQVCGDAHLVNFGIYSSPERRLMFDLNDFDETLPGPWEWDAKRSRRRPSSPARTTASTRRRPSTWCATPCAPTAARSPRSPR